MLRWANVAVARRAAEQSEKEGEHWECEGSLKWPGICACLEAAQSLLVLACSFPFSW